MDDAGNYVWAIVWRSQRRKAYAKISPQVSDVKDSDYETVSLSSEVPSISTVWSNLHRSRRDSNGNRRMWSLLTKRYAVSEAAMIVHDHVRDEKRDMDDIQNTTDAQIISGNYKR